MTTEPTRSGEVTQAPAATAPSLPSGAANLLVGASEGPAAATSSKGAVRTAVSLTGQHGEFGVFVHECVREYIQLADQKAAFVFAASTALLAFLYNSGTSKLWLEAPGNWTWIDAVAFLSMVGLAATCFLAVVTVFPRLAGAKPGVVFFNAIASHSDPAAYAATVAALTHSELAAAQLQHCYELARVCTRKYAALRRSFIAGAAAMVATLVFLLFG